jgi:hypothetical protein
LNQRTEPVDPVPCRLQRADVGMPITPTAPIVMGGTAAQGTMPMPMTIGKIGMSLIVSGGSESVEKDHLSNGRAP